MRELRVIGGTRGVRAEFQAFVRKNRAHLFLPKLRCSLVFGDLRANLCLNLPQQPATACQFRGRVHLKFTGIAFKRDFQAAEVGFGGDKFANRCEFRKIPLEGCEREKRVARNSGLDDIAWHLCHSDISPIFFMHDRCCIVFQHAAPTALSGCKGMDVVPLLNAQICERTHMPITLLYAFVQPDDTPVVKICLFELWFQFEFACHGAFVQHPVFNQSSADFGNVARIVDAMVVEFL